ncbi:MAG: hydrogenase iron-sulfur subunit [Thermoplasmata archaeon]|nr:MAG: hydrogenase iron-sulfur subunit [Thermoplasmata archaeon]MCD6222348.1 hydrogenase iron-sulfur subunit [Thermoplasmata archaeon]
MSFEPKIVAFLCNWCAYAGADLAGVSRLKYPANIIPIKVLCSGRIDPEFILHAFRNGADGVLVGGCHPGDCHYIKGNYYARRRILLTKKLLKEMGINERRLRLEWVSATEGRKFATVVSQFVEEIRQLGPLEARK